MKRKINRVGTGTLTVSLPSKWATKYGLKQGDEVEVNEHGTSLIIGHKGKKDYGTYHLHVKNESTFVKRFINVPYALGYNEIRVTFDDPNVLNKVNAAVTMIVGFEVVEIGKNYCVLKNIASGLDEEFETVFRRLLFIAGSMGDDLCRALKEKRLDKIKDILSSGLVSDRLDHFCRRLINLGALSDNRLMGLKYHATRMIENIADSIEHICNSILEEQKFPKLETEKLIEISVRHYHLFTEILLKNKPEELSEFKQKTWDLIRKQLKKNFDKAPLLDAYITAWLINLVMSTEVILSDSVRP